MKTKELIRKLAIMLGLFLTAVGSFINDSKFIIIGIIITIIGEAIFLLK